jgi:hypothetical protein
MKMKRMLCAAVCFSSLALPIFGQTRRAEPLVQPAAAPPYQHQVLATRPYQQTWYDALLRQFNPDNLDWGHWLEQRREVFFEQTAANPYFKYSLVTTTLLMLLAIALAKSQIDKSRIKWLAAERHEDLLRQDRHSRRIAHEAIRRHNAHMEKCNRVVEREAAAQRDLQRAPTAVGSQSEEQLLKQADMERERAALEAKLEVKNAVLTDLASRFDQVQPRGENQAQSNGHEEVSVSRAAELMRKVNELQQQLYHERERNKRLKGL